MCPALPAASTRKLWPRVRAGPFFVADVALQARRCRQTVSRSADKLLTIHSFSAIAITMMRLSATPQQSYISDKGGFVAKHVLSARRTEVNPMRKTLLMSLPVAMLALSPQIASAMPIDGALKAVTPA